MLNTETGLPLAPPAYLPLVRVGGYNRTLDQPTAYDLRQVRFIYGANESIIQWVHAWMQSQATTAPVISPAASSRPRRGQSVSRTTVYRAMRARWLSGGCAPSEHAPPCCPARRKLAGGQNGDAPRLQVLLPARLYGS